MFKKFIPVLVVLFALVASVLPAYASSNHAAIKITDQTTNTNLCWQAEPSGCPGIWLTSGHKIKFLLSESTNTPGNQFDLLVDNDATVWNYRGWGLDWTYSGTEPTCTVTETSTRWSVSCTSTSDNILSIYLNGEATSASDQSTAFGITRITGFSSSRVDFDYLTP